MHTDFIDAPVAAAAAHPGPTGPRTEEGKKRCRFNALRHGLTAQNVVFTEEELAIYSEHSRRIHGHYQPVGPIEEALVRYVADGIWRLDRASSIEHGIFALSLASLDPTTDVDAAVGPANTWRQECKELTLLTLYVKRIDNKLAAHKAELKALQNERAHAEQSHARRQQADPQAAPKDPAGRKTTPPESVFSPIPIKPAAVPIQPEIHLPGPDSPQQRDAA